MARSGALNVFIEDISPRARWIFKLMLDDLLGLKLNLTNEVPADQPILNYSTKDIPGSVTIRPYGLLSEQRIKSQDIVMGQYEGSPVFFLTDGGDLPFDPFSMGFYLVSRYEEYLPFESDAHGRFPHTESLAFKEDFLNMPLVNWIAIKVKNLLTERYPDITFEEGNYRFIPTVDVDIAYAHLGKGFVRTWGAIAKLLLRGNLKEIGQRFSTMLGSGNDPYDNFDMLLELFSGHKPDAIFFILAGDPGPYDRNLSVKNKRFAALIRKLSKKAEIGVHPSYGAGSNIGKIEKEIRRIEGITGKKITKSRQHFLKMSLPDTYESLIEAGITDDYSMGYASMPGFRASIANLFSFYNLRKEEETSLIIHPFMFMDTTFSDYLKLEPHEYQEATVPLSYLTKMLVRGELIGIWHNYALADDEQKHKALKDLFKLFSNYDQTRTISVY